MKPARPESVAMMRAAANRLHHLSMRYGGAVVELAQGKPCGLLEKDYPGLHEVRDVIDLVLLCRAEINALTNCLALAGHLDLDAFTRQVKEEMDWLCEQKAKFLGVEVSDVGLVFKKGKEGP